MKSDLDTQIRMNRFFLSTIPDINKIAFEEVAEDAIKAEFSSLSSPLGRIDESGIGNEPKMKRMEGVFFA
jgi:hypothetical protein